MTKSSNKDKPPAHNLHSGHPPEPVNCASPDTNQLNSFALSDDESIPSKKKMEDKIDNLCSVVEAMNMKSDRQFTSLNN